MPTAPGSVVPARIHRYAALLLGLLVLSYLWPALIGGKLLSPIADLYAYVPWKGYATNGVAKYENWLLADVPISIYPWRFLLREFIRAGTFPAWNPYVLGGAPMYQNPAAGLFSVFDLPLWILSLTYALGVSAALKLLAGGFGAYLLVRQLRLGFLPGLLAGVSFAFAAFNITWLTHDTLTAVAVMVPWSLWLIERLFERRRPRDAFGLAAVTAIGLGGGHPGMQVHLLVVTGGYALLRAACVSRPRLPPLLLIGSGLAAGTLLMAFMLIPEVRSAHGTVGVSARQHGSLPGEQLPFSSLKTVLFPDWWGQPGGAEAPIDASNITATNVNYCERTFYAGTVALLFACFGLLAPDGWRRKAPFAVLGALGLAVAVRAPGLIWLARTLPVVKQVEPQRLHFAFELAVAVLAAFGLQALLAAPPPHRRWLAVTSLGLLGGIFALVTAHPHGQDVAHTITHFLKGTDYASKAVLAMTSVIWFMIFTLGVVALLLLARGRPRWRRGIAVAVVALAAVDAHHFVGRFQPMGPASKVIPPITPAVAYLEHHRGDGRIVGLQSAMPNDWPLVYGLRDVRGYDSPQPTARMLALWRVATPEQLGWRPLALEGLERAQRNVMSVLGARYIVTPPEFDASSAGRQSKLTAVYRGSDAQVLANAKVTPRAFVPAGLRVTANESATRAAIAEVGFDPRTMAAVERGQPGVSALAHHPIAHGAATIVKERNASVTLRTRLDRRGLVLLDDDFTDGWRVRVDGRPAPALFVDDVMRGVIVPPGRHEVVWSYTVPGLRLGLLVSLLTFVALVGVAVSLRVAARLSTARLRR